jgi:DNA-binding transcriptional regulator LsrR (DeoR family)
MADDLLLHFPEAFLCWRNDGGEDGVNAEDDQLHVRVAWLYHMEDMTQGAIAERLGLTRLKVNRILAECRARGLVQISIRSKLQACVALERRLVREFGLRDAVVIPTPDDQDKVPALVGMAAGEFLTRHLARETVAKFGIGWGATLREAIRFMEPASLPGLRIVSMMGGLTQGLDLNTFEIAGELARRLQARCSYLVAPLYAGSAASREIIMAQDVFAETFALMAAIDLALLSLGDLTTRSLLVRHGLPADIGIAEIAAAGAVGDIMGRFLDARGRPIDHPINARAVTMALDGLARIPCVVVAAGGLNKAAVIAAALQGGFLDVLVSDERSVAAALALIPTG